MKTKMKNHRNLRRKRRGYSSFGITIVYGLLILNLGVLAYAINLFKTEGNQCVADPLIYGAKGLADANNQELLCSCNLLGDVPTPTMYFDSEKRWLEKDQSGTLNSDYFFNETAFENLLGE